MLRAVVSLARTLRCAAVRLASTAPVVAAPQDAPRLIARYEKEFPLDLFRVQRGEKVLLRDFEVQKKRNRFAFDVKLVDGHVVPMPNDGIFYGPNGMSLRPGGNTFGEIVLTFPPSVTIILIPKGTPIPPELVLLHEHTDHYSVQTTRKITLKELNARLTEFLRPMRRVTRDEYFAAFPLSRFV